MDFRMSNRAEGRAVRGLLRRGRPMYYSEESRINCIVSSRDAVTLDYSLSGVNTR